MPPEPLLPMRIFEGIAWGEIILWMQGGGLLPALSSAATDFVLCSRDVQCQECHGNDNGCQVLPVATQWRYVVA